MKFRRGPAESDDALAKYGEIAQAIGDGVAALGPDAFADGANPLPAVFEKVEAETRRKRLLELFSELPAEQRLALLTATFQDDEFQTALAAERERAVVRGAFADSVEQLAIDGLRYKRLDLRRVPDGAIVGIQLYDRPALEAAGHHTPIVAHCYRYIETVARPDGTQMVLTDHRREGHGSTLTFDANEIAHIGTRPTDSAGVLGDLEPVLYRSSPLHFVADEYHEGGPAYAMAMCGKTQLVIGQISIGERSLFRQ